MNISTASLIIIVMISDYILCVFCDYKNTNGPERKLVCRFQYSVYINSYVLVIVAIIITLILSLTGRYDIVSWCKIDMKA